MSARKHVFDFHWDVNKYKKNYDPKHWDLCRTFMETHKTKYSEQKLALLTEAFYQIGVYGSSYDPKTTRMVNALAVEVLDDLCQAKPGVFFHPFNKSTVASEVPGANGTGVGPCGNSVVVSSEGGEKPNHSKSIWDKVVDESVIANVLVQDQMRALFKGFVIMYDVRKTSTMNDNKTSILEESFKRSKYGPCHWIKEDTQNAIWPIQLKLKWRSIVLAEAMGADEKSLKNRLAQAILSKMANFSSGIEAKWSYYRDGRVPDIFLYPPPGRTTSSRYNISTKSNVYKVIPRSQFKVMAEAISFIDTFANSDSFAEVVFGLDFSTSEKRQITDYIDKHWNTKLNYRLLTKLGVKNKVETYVCVYQIRSGEDMRIWLESFGGENERYRLIPPGEHRRAGPCDKNVQEVLTTTGSTNPNEKENEVKVLRDENISSNKENKNKEEEAIKDALNNITVLKNELENKLKKLESPRKIDEYDKQKKNSGQAEESRKPREMEKINYSKNVNELEKKKESEKRGEAVKPPQSKKSEEVNRSKEDKKNKETEKPKESKTQMKIEEDLESLLDGFVLLYNTNRTSEIDTDDWFTALTESFKLSKFGPLEVICENIRPLRTRCVFNWKDKTLASAEGLTETQAKTAATLQLMSKLEPFTYIIQAKEEYFCGGKVPPFIEKADENKSDFFKIVRRKDLPSYYTIFNTLDEFVKTPNHGELIFGPDFTWELKNEIVVYLKAKGLDYRYFTMNDQKPWTHMAVYHTINPETLKQHLLENGGENEKYKLISPSKTEQVLDKNSEDKASKEIKKLQPEVQKTKSTEKVAEIPEKKNPIKIAETSTKKTPIRVTDKRKLEEKEPPPQDKDSGKIQIKLKKFKKDKVEYPEDTGGDFPGLILWVGIRKNSVCQRNLFNILIDSFKMSKYGELTIEECEENVWGRKDPLKKCIIKSNRKVLAVGLGETKTEAKNSASVQIMRQLRKHCYAIQAKESYFKEGKATPFDFKPDPKKSHVYRLIQRKDFKDRFQIVKYIDDFHKKTTSEELIFGDDFTFVEREHILDVCRKINLPYRFLKCQSVSKNIHTHVAVFHQLPPPAIKAELIKEGGENDMYRLIPPGGIITNQISSDDMWPETLCSAKEEQPQVTDGNNVNSSLNSTITNSTANPSIVSESDIQKASSSQKRNEKISDNTKQIPVKMTDTNSKQITKSSNSNLIAVKKGTKSDKEPIQNFSNRNSKSQLTQNEVGTASLQTDTQEVPFGPQPQFAPASQVYGSLMDVPLQFGPQPATVHVQDQAQSAIPHVGIGDNLGTSTTKVPEIETVEAAQNVVVTVKNKPEIVDLREELNRKRQAERPHDKAYDRHVDEPAGSRKVFMYEPRSSSVGSGTGRRQIRSPMEPDITSDRGYGAPRGRNFERPNRANSPGRRYERLSPNNDRNKRSPLDSRRISPRRNLNRDIPREPYRARERSPRDWPREERIVRQRETSHERRVFHNPDIERKEENFRGNFRGERRDDKFREDSFREGNVRDWNASCLPESKDMDPRRSPASHGFRDLWDNISRQLSDAIIMYKYVREDSTTETDPYALLRATRSLTMNLDFDFIKERTPMDDWYVSVELITDSTNIRPLVGEGFGRTEQEASLIAAQHAVYTIQRACRTIEPNYEYFMEGEVPEFIRRRSPMKTTIYEIIQNMNPGEPLERYTVEMIFNMFINSKLEDLFFLTVDFSFLERVLITEVALQMGLSYRTFGTRPYNERSANVCVYKTKSVPQLIQDLVANGGYTPKFTLIDPYDYRASRSRSQRDHF